MRPRLLQAQLAGQGGQAVAVGGGQQDAGDVERVQDFRAVGPEPRGLQEVDVQARPVTDRLAMVEE